MEIIVTNIAESGRVLIPANIRKSLDLDVGDELIMKVDNGTITLMSRAVAVRKAQELVAQHIKTDKCLSDELIKMRREEAARELQE